MKNKDMDQLTDPAYYILLSVLEARHGYAIMQYVEEISDGEFTVGPATLYTLVKKLEKANLVALLESGDDRRKTYKATEKGESILRSEIERRSRIVEHGKHAFQLLKEKEKSEKKER
ncbi:PadR family transcriptional regulator [Bacillus aerolatus]|uniref:PadR family transcriptional regulator n=1 Tax=Bacillus aerolatus TaxID=2653354 RepID=UPI001CDD0672|nr:PadR family transcriptional regulator [Bacillus aerolatus]